MVRVLKCHSFASQQVIPVQKEPLSIYAAEDKIFVATIDCEIIVYKVSQGSSSVIKTIPSVSLVDKILYNSFRNYIVTIEQKKSWKRVMHSVRVYLNWEIGTNAESKSRTKVRIAGKSHVQHVSAIPDPNMMDIIEVPVDYHATSVDVCRLTGNFAVACGQEVKICSIVEKTVANTNRIYLDVEMFLELCWNFSVISISLCEEFVLCCSKTEVQGVKVKYVERQHSSIRAMKQSSVSPVTIDRASLMSKGSSDSLYNPSAGQSPQSVISDTYAYPESLMELDKEKEFSAKSNSYGFKEISGGTNHNLSTVGMRTAGGTQALLSHGTTAMLPTVPVNDEHFQEWNFHPTDGCSGAHTLCLPRLQSKITLAHCHHKGRTICPRVVPNSSGGSVKSNLVVETETVVYLNESRGKEEWISVQLVPSHLAVPHKNLYHPPSSTDRLKSFYHSSRTNMCCYVSGARGGYLFQLAPIFTEISTYKYSERATKVCCAKSHLHVSTDVGVETYTSRWATVALESLRAADNEEHPLLLVHPPVKLEICLCGHEPFIGVVDLSVGNDFLALLSKVQDIPGVDECAWSLYIIHCFSLKTQFEDMMQFAEAIQRTGPSSYIHLLQEAHLLISSNLLFGSKSNEELQTCLQKVCRLLGDYYAEPDQEGWRLCSVYYKSLNVSADVLVAHSKRQAKKNSYGKGIVDYLERLLFSDADDSLLPSSDSAADVLDIFFHSAPENFSRIILLSRLQSYKSEVAFRYLKDIFDDRARTGRFVCTVDKLAMTQLHLDMCEVDLAQSQQDSISRSELVHECVQHPKLIQTDHQKLTPLAQLLRRHRSAALLEILVQMLDECVISLDSLLILLKNQDEVDLLHNSHIKQVLELVLTDAKRIFLFENVATHLCDIYLTQIREAMSLKVPRHISQGTQMKFTLPQGNGYFAPRFSWLDELPPFLGSERMLKRCRHLGGKHHHNGSSSSSQASSKPVTDLLDSARQQCPCCQCNENLLKLQSLLCSQHFSEELARHVLNTTAIYESGAIKKEKAIGDKLGIDDSLDSIFILCEVKMDIGQAMQRIVDSYPKVSATFASTCLGSSRILYSELLRCLEAIMKDCATASPHQHSERTYVRSYKALLNKASEMFTPAQFIELLPSDGKLIFFIPYLKHNLEKEHVNSLKNRIINLGSELLSMTN